jgi:hypothetical protein
VDLRHFGHWRETSESPVAFFLYQTPRLAWARSAMVASPVHFVKPAAFHQ